MLTKEAELYSIICWTVETQHFPQIFNWMLIFHFMHADLLPRQHRLKLSLLLKDEEKESLLQAVSLATFMQEV